MNGTTSSFSDPHGCGAFQLLQEHLPLQRRVLHSGDHVYRAGERFASLHVIHSGSFKMLASTSDGREQIVSLHLKGDWLGFDGISRGEHECDAIAMDTGEIWSVRYETLLRACIDQPVLMNLLHTAMSREMSRERDWLASLCTLSADARVAEFLRNWVESLDRRGLRTDCVKLRMTRAEIGSYLGIRLESVSRAMSRLAKEQVIRFAEKGRREVEIPDAAALDGFVQRSLNSSVGACS